MVPAVDWQDPEEVVVSRHTVRVPKLPRPLDGVRIGHVSDLHLYDGIHRTARHALAALERERPDLVVLTGDQWDSRRGRQALPDWLTSLPVGLPAAAVLGNHDYSTGTTVGKAVALHERGGADLLVNRAGTHALNGAALTIVGLDDLRHGRPDAQAAAATAPDGVPQIWLVHEPAHVDLLDWPDQARPALILSGHTHGGQIRLPGMPPVMPRGAGRYVAGWYHTAGGPMYVSRGVGSVWIRSRFRCPPELPVFTLRTA